MVRRCADGFHEKRGVRQAAWLGLAVFALIGIGTTTCGSVEGVLVPCSDSVDCHGHPGMVCVNERCVCAENLELCNGECRPKGECGQASGGADSCVTAADCKQPGDYRCGKAICVNGLCGLDLKPLSKIASQRAGDCKERWCDGQGNLVEFTEASDVYNDGTDCIANSCEAGKPVNTPLLFGELCPVTGEGVCFEGECVECLQGYLNCAGDPLCDYTQCVPPHCVNNKWEKESGETYSDCGGLCRGCSAGEPCNVSSDCHSGVCTQGTCKAATCSDGIKNAKETGIDCGGSSGCPPCPSGQGCKLPSECLSGVCWAGVCEAPSCTDGVMNGDEVGEDCGGLCEACP
jgi:hypothetical protein